MSIVKDLNYGMDYAGFLSASSDLLWSGLLQIFASCNGEYNVIDLFDGSFNWWFGWRVMLLFCPRLYITRD
jgi:hypothetical protein